MYTVKQPMCRQFVLVLRLTKNLQYTLERVDGSLKSIWEMQKYINWLNVQFVVDSLDLDMDYQINPEINGTRNKHWPKTSSGSLPTKQIRVYKKKSDCDQSLGSGAVTTVTHTMTLSV